MNRYEAMGGVEPTDSDFEEYIHKSLAQQQYDLLVILRKSAQKKTALAARELLHALELRIEADPNGATDYERTLFAKAGRTIPNGRTS